MKTEKSAFYSLKGSFSSFFIRGGRKRLMNAVHAYFFFVRLENYTLLQGHWKAFSPRATEIADPAGTVSIKVHGHTLQVTLH